MTTRILTVFAGSLALAALALFMPGRSYAEIEHAQTGALGEPVLVELFTSQGCSSCPPADRLAARLAQENNLVVIARPVTYWDRLGWKDTLAREANTDLQRDYARRGLAGRNGVYTPQVVVDGALGTIGSFEGDIRAHIKLAQGSQQAAIRARKQPQGGYEIGLGGTANGSAELALIAVSRTESVNIGRGENGGRRITYTNVLVSEETIADWAGGKARHILAPAQLITPGADRHALILRQPGGGEVLAARWLD